MSIDNKKSTPSIAMRIYFDNCCYNRPFDNQEGILVRLETDAKLHIQELVKNRKLELVWSFVLDYENSFNPFADRRERIQLWRNLSLHYCGFSESVAQKAESLMRLGFKQADAAHVACAIISQADYFITTDKRVLNKNLAEIRVVNPIAFIERFINAN